MLFMNTFKLFFSAIICLLFVSCLKEHQVNCNKPDGTYICFNNEGRDAIYAKWNFDTVQTFNTINIQGSYPAVPGTTGPWTTLNLSLVTTTGNYSMEIGSYTYYDFLTNVGIRKFTFWVKRYEGDAKDPIVKNFEKDPAGTAVLNITGMDSNFKLSGIFEANIVNVNDSTETGLVKYLFNGVELQ